MGHGKIGPRVSEDSNVLCFGHPLLDMMANVDAKLLADYGIDPGSVNLSRPDQTPLFDRLLEEHAGLVLVPGGSAMNTARALRWVLPTIVVSYVGSLGDDKFARILKASLDKAGVVQIFEEHKDMPTGTCAALVMNKERSLLANLGAAVALSLPHFMSEAVQRAVKRAHLYYAEGFFLNTASSPDGLLSVALHSYKKKKVFCLNLNAPYICTACKEHIDLLMPYINILFGNGEDILAYAAVTWPEEFAGASNSLELVSSAVVRLCAIPSRVGNRLVVATRGTESTCVGFNGSVTMVAVPAMEPDDIVDLNGAGDSFVGGFIAQYLLSKDAVLSTQVGHATAQNCIRHHGATVGGCPPKLHDERGNKY